MTVEAGSRPASTAFSSKCRKGWSSSSSPPSWSCRVEGCRRSSGATLTARTIHSSPTSRTLTHPGACSKCPRNIRSPVSAYGEDRAVHGAMEHGERRVPAGVSEQALERGEDAVEELPDRLAAEEALVVRDDSAERVHELVLELVGRDRRESRSPRSSRRSGQASSSPSWLRATISAVSHGCAAARSSSDAVEARRARAGSRRPRPARCPPR